MGPRLDAAGLTGDVFAAVGDFLLSTRSQVFFSRCQMLRIRSLGALLIFGDRDLQILAHTALLHHLSILRLVQTVHRRALDLIADNLLIGFALAQNVA